MALGLKSAVPHSIRRAGYLLFLVLLTVLMAALVRTGNTADPEPFRFVILGDRTGEAQPGVYEHVWREVALENPALVVSVGDTIQGLSDGAAESEWNKVEQ